MAVVKNKGEHDLRLADISNASIGPALVGQLAVKGFCTVDLGLDDATLKLARADAKQMATAGEFYQPPFQVMEGLLGPEGSCRIAEMEAPHIEMSDYPSLKLLDERFSQLYSDITPSAEELGFQINLRTSTVVHEVGTANDDTPPLTEKVVSKWLYQFQRHQIMAILFLGPSKGTLELQPYDTDEADAFEVRAVPGMLVLLQAEHLSHKYYAPGSAVSLTSFFLTSKQMQQFGASLTMPMTPVARELDEWVLERLRQIKENEQEDTIWNQEIPRDWQLAMNHLFHKGQMIAVKGVAIKTPKFTEMDPWFSAHTCGIDLVTEVPGLRWDHTQFYVPYEEDPECYKRWKTYCKHAAFMEGIELFDPKLFGMSPAEAKSIDPHQRIVLENGYDSLYRAGLRKKQLMNSKIGHYCGFGCLEWSLAEKSDDGGVFAATGTAASIVANRFNFCLGMKGPSMCLDTEGASSLTALYLGAEGCQSKGRGQANPYSVCSGVQLLLAVQYWASHCAAGWLSHKGRCFSFDESAHGFVRGDGAVAATVKAVNDVDGLVKVEDDIMVGLIASGVMNQNGLSSTLSAPSGPAEQECIAEAVRNARISSLDIDAVEAWAAGSILHDAVEIASHTRGHRSEMAKEPLFITATKTGIGNSVEAAGLCAFIRTLVNGSWGVMTPNKHLSTMNPHIESSDTPVFILTEVLEYRVKSSFTGTFARGFGGSNVYMMNHMQVDTSKVSSINPVAQQTIAFWPGGGGTLESDLEPVKTYSIAGSFNKWGNAVPMSRENDGTFTYTITLGENVFEQFQIWLDGDSEKALHPGWPNAGKDAPVVGPTAEGKAQGCNWIIDGRGELQELWKLVSEVSESELTSVIRREPYEGEEYALLHTSLPTPDAGKVGDQYKVRLQIFGKWRAVNWCKLEAPTISDLSLTEGGKYYIVGSWGDWSFEEMTKGGDDQFRIEVSLTRNRGEFQIVRDMDWAQVFYPATPSGSGNEYIIGPRDGGHGLNWEILGQAGESYRITFERRVSEGEHVKKISWEKI